MQQPPGKQNKTKQKTQELYSSWIYFNFMIIYFCLLLQSKTKQINTCTVKSIFAFYSMIFCQVNGNAWKHLSRLKSENKLFSTACPFPSMTPVWKPLIIAWNNYSSVFRSALWEINFNFITVKGIYECYSTNTHSDNIPPGVFKTQKE